MLLVTLMLEPGFTLAVVPFGCYGAVVDGP